MKPFPTRFLFAVAALGATLPVPAEVPDWSGYSKSVKITFPGHAGSQELQNFPVLVRVSAENGFNLSRFKLPDGGDLRFSDADGNLLAHEIDTWTPGGESLVWVKVPLLTSDTEIVAHYGNATPAAVPASSGVWSEGYAGVWHMNAAAGVATQADSTGHGLDATVPAAVADGVEAGVSGAVGSAAAFDKRSDHKGGYAVEDGSQMLHGQRAMTWEVWSKQAALPSYNAYLLRMSPYASGVEDAYKIYEWNGTGLPVAYPRVTKTDGTSASQTYWPSGKIPPLDRWNHLVWRYDGDAGSKAMVLNGDVSGKYSGTADKGAILSLPGGGGLTVGNFTTHLNANAFPGSLDEIRISSVVRSDAWIAATYATIADETFASYEAIASGGNDWTKYAKKFRISFPGVGSGVTLTNFPVLVKLSASSPSGFRYADCAKAEGADLRFSDSSGNALDSEVETWNDANGESFVWVKIPELTSSTLIRGYYGWAEAPAADSSAVWSEGYAGVWHMNAAAGAATQTDSTTNRLDATVPAAVADGIEAGVSGAVGMSAAFDRRSDHKGGYLISDASGRLCGHENMTWEFWTFQSAIPTAANAYVLRGLNVAEQKQSYYCNERNNNGRTCMYIYQEPDAATNVGFWPLDSSTPAPTLDDWNYHVYRLDGAGGVKTAFLNGGTIVGPATSAANKGTVYSAADQFFIGNHTPMSSGNAFPGSLDEVRISSVARSDAWLAATRATIADNAAFTTYGAASDNSQGTVVFFR